MQEIETIRARVDRFTHTLRTAYQRAVQPSEDPRPQATLKILRQVPLLQGFGRPELKVLSEALHSREYKPDEFIYRERDPSLGLYFVEHGSVRFYVEETNGALQELRTIHEYGVFGELAVLGDFRRLETAQAVKETRVLGFFRPELKYMMKQQPRIAALLLHALGGYVAAQYIAYNRAIAEKEGRVVAMKMQDLAVQRSGARLTTPGG
ncbi:MAG: cyclic nucleotide-binding domain-containing protein [Rhodothermales bacterium]|nr:cyclic nucleotide-binding domain-containing protein [Rhodothermales bacterium]